MVQLKPVKKESYFTYVDCMISSPAKDKLMVTTNFCKKFLLDVRSGVLSRSSCSTSVPGVENQRVYRSAENRGCYALATNAGVSLCRWDDVASTSGSVEPRVPFYSVDWIGDNIIAGTVHSIIHFLLLFFNLRHSKKKANMK